MKMQSKRLLIALTLLLVGLPGIGSLRADTIDWGFDFFPTDSVDSFGTDLTASYSFYLGTFDTSGAFPAPTSANTGSWATNWNQIDSTSYNVGVDWFRDSESITDNATFIAGDQVYIWGSSNLAPLGTDGEWILITAPTWTVPVAEPTDPTVHEFFLSDTGVSTVVGTVNSGGFDLQTEAIPEPASALFFSISAIWFLFRRPRRATS